LVKKANPAVTLISCFLTYADLFVGAAVSSKFCIVVSLVKLIDDRVVEVVVSWCISLCCIWKGNCSIDDRVGCVQATGGVAVLLSWRAIL
jgi:hypothetical protein